MAKFKITINQDDLLAVKNLMAGIKDCIPAITTRAVNRVLSGVKTDASAEIASVMNITKSGADKTFKIRSAVIGGQAGAIASTGAYIPLMDMKGTKQTKKGVSVQVLKAHPRKVIRSAFITTMKNKKTGAQTRRGVFRRVSKGRFPIKELYTSSVPDIIARPEVIKKILEKADARLHERLWHEMDYELSKHV